MYDFEEQEPWCDEGQPEYFDFEVSALEASVHSPVDIILREADRPMEGYLSEDGLLEETWSILNQPEPYNYNTGRYGLDVISHYPVPGRYLINPKISKVAQGDGRAGGERKFWDKVTKKMMTSIHTGMDVAMPLGTPVYSAGYGIIEHRGGVCGGIAIDHGNGVKSIYCHLDTTSLPKVGAQVFGGERIARTGSGGNLPKFATPHLHFAVEVDGVRVDPQYQIFKSINFATPYY